jgi:broad specificity phosphatase PhoE
VLPADTRRRSRKPDGGTLIGMRAQLWLIRHGETEWSLSGAHTGRTDIPLTSRGEEQAARLDGFLAGRRFALVLASPLQRARETCRMAGYGDIAQIEPDLREWDYGDYEGRTTAEIRKERPGWSLWEAGVPGGETIGQVAARAQHVIERAVAAGGDAALFAHGHILRVLAACWIGLPPGAAKLLALDTASVSVLGYERETRVITRWNQTFADGD